MHVVLVQDAARGETPYEVYEVGDDGNVVASLGEYADLTEALKEANVYGSASGLRVVDEATNPPVAESAHVNVSRFDTPSEVVN